MDSSANVGGKFRLIPYRDLRRVSRSCSVGVGLVLLAEYAPLFRAAGLSGPLLSFWLCPAVAGRAQDVPPYVIFHDKTLIEMAHERPKNLLELGDIQGVGARKLERYGAEFLALLAEPA